MNAPCSDPVVEAVVSKLRKRSEVGVNKYKTTLADAGLSRLELLRHAQAECMDQANYLETLIQMEDEGRLLCPCDGVAEDHYGNTLYRCSLEKGHTGMCMDEQSSGHPMWIKVSPRSTVIAREAPIPQSTENDIRDLLVGVAVNIALEAHKLLKSPPVAK